MGCGNCNGVEREPLVGERFELSTTQTSVLGKDELWHRVMAPMVKSGFKPVSGWGVVTFLNGQHLVVPAFSAKGAFNEVKKLLSINDVKITDLNIWFNLNVQWLGRTREVGRLVRLETLLLLHNQ